MTALIPKLKFSLPLICVSFAALGLSSACHADTSVIEHILGESSSIVTIQAQKITAGSTMNSGPMEVREQSGAGVIIDPAGYIATNTHIILYADRIFVTLSNGIRLPATIAAIAPATDFSILKIDAPFSLEALPWADPHLLTLGTKIISVGNTPLWKETICGGTITGIANTLSTGSVGLIEMDLALDRGDSGGPVLDRQGQFLGIIVAKNMKVERSSYALPAWNIREFFLNYLIERQKENVQ
ncbi:MAG: serine protease [Candidatus Omnitrophica bacterium]|nr:serine protease [Candidatus Omnitrophota bacterium]